MADKPKYARWPLQLYRTGYVAALFLTSLAIGGALADHSKLHPVASFYVAMAIVFCGNTVLIAAHEFGHAIAGALMGWRIALIAIGPLSIRPQPFRIKLGTPAMGGSFSGATWPVPPPSPSGLRAKWIATFAGGPLANFSVAGAGWLVAEATPISGIAKVVVLSFSTLSVAKGVLNLMPFKVPLGGRSDGGAIWDLLRGEDPEPRSAILRTFDRTIAGVRPRSWPEYLVTTLTANLQKATGGHEATLLYAYHLDRAEFAAARSFLDRALKTNGPVETLLMEDAFLSAYGDHDYARAEAFMGRVRTKRVRRSPRYFQVQAMLAFAKNDPCEGERQIWMARKALRKTAITTDADWDAIQSIEDRFAVAPAGSAASPA